jgi:hypothetical protein
LAATDQFFQLRKTITKELELEVAILGKTLKDKIAGGEAEIAAIVAALSDDKLVNMKLTDIDAQWQRIDMEFEQRNAWILQLSAQVSFLAFSSFLLLILFAHIVISLYSSIKSRHVVAICWAPNFNDWWAD